MKRLFKLALLGAIAFGVIKMMEMKREFMVGTEEELRERVRTKMGHKVPAEKLGEVEDKVVGYARSKGTLLEPIAPPASVAAPSEEAGEPSEEAGDTSEETSDDTPA